MQNQKYKLTAATVARTAKTTMHRNDMMVKKADFSEYRIVFLILTKTD